MIHIADTKVERRYGQYFLRQIGKFADLQRNMNRVRPERKEQNH